MSVGSTTGGDLFHAPLPLGMVMTEGLFMSEFTPKALAAFQFALALLAVDPGGLRVGLGGSARRRRRKPALVAPCG